MDKVYLPFYYSWRDKTKNLSDEEFGKLTRAILLFGETGELTSGFSPPCEMAYEFITDVIERSQRRADEGRKAANKRWNNKQPNNDLIGSQKQPITTNTNTNTYINTNSVSSAHTHTPTREEVVEYFKEQGYSFADRFYSYYQSTGWEGVEDWKSRAALWKLDDDKKAQEKKNEADKHRYGNFDVQKAFDAAIKRSYKKS